MESYIIGGFYNWVQKARESKDAFINKLKALICNIQAWKPAFRKEADEALWHQYALNLWVPYFGIDCLHFIA